MTTAIPRDTRLQRAPVRWIVRVTQSAEGLNAARAVQRLAA